MNRALPAPSWAPLIAIAALALAGCNEVVVPSQNGCLLDGDCRATEICRDGTCVSSTLPVAPDGGFGCTPATEAEACGVGAFCNADGRCATLPDCAQGCPSGFVCNAANVCVREGACGPNCPDALFCNGVETCNSATGECLAGTPPCGGDSPICDEASRSCLCGDDFDCDGADICENGVCTCVPDCSGKECGDDGCGGTCGACEGAGNICNNGQCSCTPDCSGKVCGDDGCGGTCGPGCSQTNDECVSGQCVCTPDCAGRQCGDDGCGGSCGVCGGGTCSPNGLCNCTPNCAGRECGDDGCGGTCGPGCLGAEACSPQGQCDCTPDCAGRECGDNGCGGTCGDCHETQSCNNTAGTCFNTGNECDAFTDGINLDEFDSFPGTLSAGIDKEYEWDGFPLRIVDDYPLQVPAPDLNNGVNDPVPLLVTVESTAFSPKLYIYRVDQGCQRIGATNNVGALVGLQGALDPAGTYRAVVTGRTELATGQYTIRTTPIICGQIFEDQAAYDGCADRMRTNSNRGCEFNPCVDFGNAPEFCCATTDQASGGFTFCQQQNPDTDVVIHLENDPAGCNAP